MSQRSEHCRSSSSGLDYTFCAVSSKSTLPAKAYKGTKRHFYFRLVLVMLQHKVQYPQTLSCLTNPQVVSQLFQKNRFLDTKFLFPNPGFPTLFSPFIFMFVIMYPTCVICKNQYGNISAAAEGSPLCLKINRHEISVAERYWLEAESLLYGILFPPKTSEMFPWRNGA